MKRKQKIILAIASGFGVGYIPVASGTFGSLLGLAIYALLVKTSIFWFLATIVLLFVIGIYVSDIAEDILLTKDPSLVVIDEVTGYLVAMFSFPAQWEFIVFGFFIFRFFDIAKIWPASYFDRKTQKGTTIMMDDIIAGIYTNICLQIIRLVL